MQVEVRIHHLNITAVSSRSTPCPLSHLLPGLPHSTHTMAEITVFPLDQAWSFKQKSAQQEEWLPTTIPTNIHLDLMAHNK